MTTGAWAAAAVALLFTIGDLGAVARGDKRLEYVCKPGATASILATCLLLDPANPTVRWWFAAALVLSLAGDVFLMLPERPLGPIDTFVGGLAAFLAGHLAYVVGFAVAGADFAATWWVAVPVVAVLWVAVGLRIVRRAAEAEAALGPPVALYVLVISAMAAFAIAVGTPWAIVGALLFVASDSILGWNRFVTPIPHGHVWVMATYLAAQGALTASLL